MITSHMGAYGALGRWAATAGPTGGAARAPKPAVISMPSPNQNSRDGHKIDTIVLHHTAGGGTAQDVGHYFQKSSAQVSSHYIIGKDGTIVQPVGDDRRAWHAGESVFKGKGDVNDFSIGIEIVNMGNGSDPYPEAQYRALAKLVAYLQTTYDVPRERITGHKDVAIPYGRKTDPSKNFSYDLLNRYVDEILGGRAPSAPAPAQPARPAPQPAAPAPAPAGSYTVRKGDSLSSIARQVLGNANRWRDLYDLNKDQIRDPNLIFPGQVLKLPGGLPRPEPKPSAPAPAAAPPQTPAGMTPAQLQELQALQQQLKLIELQLTALMYQYYGYRA